MNKDEERRMVKEALAFAHDVLVRMTPLFEWDFVKTRAWKEGLRVCTKKNPSKKEAYKIFCFIHDAFGAGEHYITMQHYRRVLEGMQS